MDEIKIVKDFKEFFESNPKGVVLYQTRGAFDERFFLCIVDNLFLQVIFSIGKRGGLSKQIVCVDPKRKPVSSQLLLNYGTRHNGGLLYSLSDIRNTVVEKNMPLASSCAFHLSKLLNDIQRDPTRYATYLRNRNSKLVETMNAVVNAP